MCSTLKVPAQGNFHVLSLIYRLCDLISKKYVSIPVYSTSNILLLGKFAFLLEVGSINRGRIWVGRQGSSWVCKIIDSGLLWEACCSPKEDGGNQSCITRASICGFHSRIYKKWVSCLCHFMLCICFCCSKN